MDNFTSSRNWPWTPPPLVRPAQDQFTYQAKIGVDDTIIYLLYQAYSHLDKPGESLRIICFEYLQFHQHHSASPTAKKAVCLQIHTDGGLWTI